MSTHVTRHHGHRNRSLHRSKRNKPPRNNFDTKYDISKYLAMGVCCGLFALPPTLMGGAWVRYALILADLLDFSPRSAVGYQKGNNRKGKTMSNVFVLSKVPSLA